MGAIEGLATGFGVIRTPANRYYSVIGSQGGTRVGVLPGVGPLAARVSMRCCRDAHSIARVRSMPTGDGCSNDRRCGYTSPRADFTAS